MNFDLSQPDIAAVGLLVHSKPHYAFSAGSASRPAATTISYPGSKIKSFTLASTYYGCETNPAQVAASVPVAYSITATGYETGSSKPVAIQEFEFSPAAGMTAPLAFGKFAAAFQSLETVTYFQSPAMPTELIMDNVAGTIGT